MLMMTLISICVISFFVLIVMSFQSQDEVRVVDRIQKVRQTSGAGRMALRDQEVMQQSLATRLLLPLADKTSKVFGSFSSAGMLEQCRKDIVMAGLTSKVTPLQIMTLTWLFAISLPVFFFFLTITQERTLMTWMIILLPAIIGFQMPRGIVRSRAAKRRLEIQKALPFTFDLISIGVEAGVSFDGAMAMVVEKTNGPLSEELNNTLNEIRLGKTKYDALKDLGERVGLDDLRTFLAAVTYISKMGGSLVDVIRVQTESLRTKRRQRAEEKAMKTPVKIMIPLVLFIFPAMFIIILGPTVVIALKL